MEGNTHAQWVLSELNQQRVLGKFCDVVLSSQSGQTLLAHRNILACFSQIFNESASSSTPCMELKLPPECPVDGVELLLQFFYTGELWLDGESEAKVRCAASDLSVPASLIPGQNLLEIKVVDCGGDAEGKPLLFTDTKPDVGANGSYVLESKVETPGPEVAELDGESPSTSTTTRSGRRVRGPSRLVGERSQLVDPNLKATRRRAPAQETIADSGGEESHTQEIHEAEPGPFDVDEDSEVADNVTDDTDEEYMPLESPSKGTRSRRQLKVNVTDKENGEGSPTDAKKGCVQCPTCHKTFLSKYYLKVHNRRHTGEKPFECSKCGKCYYRKENLHGHEARNCLSRSAMVFSCPSCPMTFKRRQQLSLHMVTHTGDMPNKCTTCSEQFMHKKELRSHMIKIHGAPKPHACPQCPKCFLSRTELRLHEAAKHRGEKLFVCEECGHRASSRNGLQMHIKSIHRKERPFVCEFCNHAFTQKANLNMHLRTHTGEKPFQCHLCGKTFRTQASLDKHNRTHTGERPFSCEFCEQRFTEKGPLLRHVASKHQVGQPQFCPICNKSFKAVEQLRVHVRRHKGMRKFECTECGYKFTRQAHLRRHLQIHNRVENYNPRQRKLRNLVVEDEKADETPASLSGRRDTAETEQDVQPAPDVEQAPVELTEEDMEEQAPDMEQAPVVEPDEDMEEQAPDMEQAPVVEPEEDVEEPAPDMETTVDVDQASVVETIDVEHAPDVETAVDLEQAPAVKPVLDLEVRPADGENVEHQLDFSVTKEEPENFTMEDMMEHTVLVTDTFPIQSDLVVELQGSGADGTS